MKTKREKRKKATKIVTAVGGIALTFIGFCTIPQLMGKYSNKIYKRSLKAEKINFDDMGPEIVPMKKGKGE